MVADAFLSIPESNEIKGYRRQAFATRKRLADPPIDLLLWRMVNGVAQQVGPREVVMTFADRLPQNQASPAAAITASSGVFEAEEPWDVKPSDWFQLPNGGRGLITVVPFPQGGKQRAEFEIQGRRA